MFILIFILLLVVLIIAHEFGHFIVAKSFGIKVHEFGVFFPPRVIARKFGETEYSLNWLPFGGFVKIFGENYDEGRDDPRSFVNKSRWKQAAVVLAGIVFNLLFAWLALSVGYMAGLPTSAVHEGYGIVQLSHPTVVAVLPDSPADRAGLTEGDAIVKVETGHESLDVRTLNTSRQAQVVTNFMTERADESIVLTVERHGAELVFLARAQDGFVQGRKVIGVQLDDIGILRLPPHLALAQGAIVAWSMTSATAQGLGQFFTRLVVGHADFSSVSGPIGITLIGAAALKEGFAAGVVLIALISVNLALINLVPIPGLDGGRLLVIIIEGIRRKPISQEVITRITVAGFLFLILLILLVSYHDIASRITG